MSRTALLAALALAGCAQAMRATWGPSAGPRPSPPRSGHTAASSGAGVCYLFGGYAEYEGETPRDVVNDLWRYAEGAWECLQPPSARAELGQSPSRPGGRLCSASAVVGDELFVFGGWDPETAGAGGTILDDIWYLNVGTLLWERLAQPMPGGPTSRHVACAVDTADGPRVVIHTFRCTDSVLVFDPRSRTTTEVRRSATPASTHSRVGTFLRLKGALCA